MRILFFLFCISFIASPVFGQKAKIVVVIDAGHGGSDPGHESCNKNHLQEKELNLIIAKKFGGYIDQNLKNITIVYTRTDDSFPTLDQRVAKANSVNADYFISIHCNANHNKSVHGTESHIHTMKSKKSLALAKEFENEFTKRAGRNSRGVKDTDDREHSLQVLKYTNMTSVLVECGFLTNDNEANYLNTTSGQDILASAIFRAFRTHIVKEYPSISFIKTGTNSSTNTTDITNQKTPHQGTYTIQIMSSKQPLNTDDQSFKKIGLTVMRKKLNTTASYKYSYQAGKYVSQDEAKKDLEKVKKNGFSDAYIIKLE